MFDPKSVPSQIGWYLAGFTDGEGSFNVSFRPREDYRAPWKVSLCFNVSQRDEVILAKFKRHLGCGTMRQRHDGVWYFEVNNLTAIRENVIPFFRRFGFLSAKKKRDFTIFQQMASLMAEGAHLHRAGIERLLELRRNMNDGGKRKHLEAEILAEFLVSESSETTCRTSSESLTGDDDIVRTAGRPAEAVRNEQPADSHDL